MKKLIAFILSGVMMMGVLASCGAPKDIDVAQAADTLKNSLKFDGNMEELGSKMLESTYNGIAADSIETFKAYTSPDITAEEIGVFETKDENAAKELKTVLDQHVTEQKDLYADYSPEGAQRLEKAVVRQNGKYVIICVAGDGSKTAAEVDKILK